MTETNRANEDLPPPADFTSPRIPWVHTSALATLGFIISVSALGITLTGVLAIEGLALGVLGALFSSGGVVAAGQSGTTGHGLAVIGVLCGLAAIALGFMAMTGELSWLNSNVNEVDRWHEWLLAHWPWLRYF